ncbi:hypothetical protein [Novosphingobium sediminicola]|uniref:Uncharacterized protein n=1 Tax=Novosphingobium sediminicola TaxID=563162 RepID=A0A7W6G6G4_9SPHN|nr:hypothetical protein [Novosphingobium sediminicola]MBB3955105.1 hypothetical protein [Novosphingobium sediminicola]
MHFAQWLKTKSGFWLEDAISYENAEVGNTPVCRAVRGDRQGKNRAEMPAAGGEYSIGAEPRAIDAAKSESKNYLIGYYIFIWTPIWRNPSIPQPRLGRPSHPNIINSNTEELLMEKAEKQLYFLDL